jgi:hypothetical protein
VSLNRTTDQTEIPFGTDDEDDFITEPDFIYLTESHSEYHRFPGKKNMAEKQRFSKSGAKSDYPYI